MKKLLLSVISVLFVVMLGAQVTEEEFQALKALYNATNGDNWKKRTGWENINTTATKDDVTSAWEGITVKDGHVVEILFWNNNMSGYLPSQIGDLKWLYRFSIYSNSLQSTIPEEIGELKELQSVDLSNNKLIGPLPASMSNLTDLRELSLNTNPLNCEFPNDILAQLNKLHYITFYNCSLTGQVGDIFGNILNLSYFDVTANKLTGELPPSLSQLTKLSAVHFGNNNFTGNLPDLGQSDQMYYLTFWDNQFSGTIPESYNNFERIQYIHFENNQLSGPVPAGLFQPGLQRIRLHENYFTFDGIEPVYPQLSDLWQKSYNTNKLFPLNELIVSANEGDQMVLNAADLSVFDLGGNNNRYKWFRNNEEIYSGNNPAITINNASAEDAGVYRFEVTNTVVNDITLKSQILMVSVMIPGNNAPTDITLDKMNVDENYTGWVTDLGAQDPDHGDTHVFMLIPGDGVNDRDNGMFAIDGNKLNINARADFEWRQQLNILLLANDLKGGLYIKPFIIEVNDLDESPYFSGQIIKNTIDETAPNGTKVFTLLAYDPEAKPVSFSIIAGNEDSAFGIEDNLLKVVDNTKFNYDIKNQYILQVEASDGNLKTEITLYISLSKINSMPTIENATFSIDENSPAGTFVGDINASDPEGDPLSFQILAGNHMDAFRLEGNNIVVNNSEAVDHETYPEFSLIINVTDGISNVQGSFTVNLNNLPDETGNDILTFSVPGMAGSPVINAEENAISAIVSQVDISAIALDFTISKGAVSDPPAGTVMNMLTPQQIIVTSETGDAKTWTVTLSYPVSIPQIDLKKIFIWPNPATDMLNISGVPAGSILNIIDSSGRLIRKFVLNSSTETIDISGLNHAVHYMIIESGDKVVNQKFIKK